MLKDKLVNQIRALDLDLQGKVVLTEAATGAYMVTPVLAALAGAEVYAFTRTTRYGTVEEVIQATRELIRQFGEGELQIHFIDTLTPEIIAKADIITNSGHLRPLNKQMLQHAKDNVVIPLMYEAWEYREADLDLSYIRQRKIKIGATNERHPDIDVFGYLGDMAVKLILDAGICLYRNKFVLVCNNDFGPYIAKAVSCLCKSLGVIDTIENRSKYHFQNVEWLGEFPEVHIPTSYKDAEAILFTAYPFDKNWVGKATEVSLNQIKNQLKDPFILRYAGDVDTRDLDEAAVRYYPAYVPGGHMGILPSQIGFDPIIRLQSGGLKVGEALLTRQYHYKNIPLLEIV